MIILKWILKELVLFLDLILHYNTGQSGNSGKFNEVILYKKISSKILQLKLSENGFKFMIFIYWLVQNFLNCRKANLCLQREKKLLLTQN